MKGRRHTPEQVVRQLREADRLLGEGQDIAEVAKHLEISEATFHRGWAQYGGMKANDAKELRQLRDENLRLKRMVADRELQIEMLKEISRDAPIDCQVAATQRSQS
jgi:transposase